MDFLPDLSSVYTMQSNNIVRYELQHAIDFPKKVQ